MPAATDDGQQYHMYQVSFDEPPAYFGITREYDRRRELDLEDARREFPWSRLGARMKEDSSYETKKLASFRDLDAAVAFLATYTEIHNGGDNGGYTGYYSPWDDTRDVVADPPAYPERPRSMRLRCFDRPDDVADEVCWRVMWRRDEMLPSGNTSCGDAFDIGFTAAETLSDSFATMMLSNYGQNCVSKTFAYDPRAKKVAMRTTDGEIVDLTCKKFAAMAVDAYREGIVRAAKEILGGASSENPFFDRAAMTRKAYEFLVAVGSLDAKQHRDAVSEVAGCIPKMKRFNHNNMCSLFPKGHERRPKPVKYVYPVPSHPLFQMAPPDDFLALAVAKKLKAEGHLEHHKTEEVSPSLSPSLSPSS